MLSHRCFSLLALSTLLLVYSCKKNDGSGSQTATGAAYVTDLLEYRPAPGQFLNTGAANDSSAKAVTGGKANLVSLGAWGGYIVYGFDHTVQNASGPDLIVYGNAFTQSAEPGVIWVMADDNGNGKPDDTWYELAGSETGQPGYLRNYSVTYSRPHPANGDVPWTDNQGHSGVVKTNLYHTQDYYPDALTADSYTFTGTLLPSVNIDTSNAAAIVSRSFSYGYADNTPSGDSVDIATAIDNSGAKVNLKGIRFVKVQTGIQFNLGSLGELSTEVAGIADLSLLK